MKNKRLFKIKYLGATNNRSSRVKIEDMRFRKSKTIPYNHDFNNTHEMADQFLKSIGIECDSMGEFGDFYVIATDNFETQIA